MKPRAHRPEYVPPAKDSARAVANAALFLAGARSLANETAEGIAYRYRLSTKRADYLLTIARQKRAKAHG